MLNNKLTKVLCISMILMLSSTSCEKKSDLSYGFQVDNIVCFPHNLIYITFRILPQGGKEPYLITWHQPDAYQGTGPFFVQVTDTLSFDFEIRDMENFSKRYSCQIKKDTIDSLKYDYRNRYAGSYSCDVKHTYNNTVRYYFDTLIVTKPEAFSSVVISNSNYDWGMNYNDTNNFYGYHRGVTFRHDSIFFSESGPLGAYYTNTYQGVKIKTK